MTKIKVSINKENCLSCGSCYATSPEVFEMDPADGKAKITQAFDGIEVTDPAMIEQIKNTAALCPNGAIVVTEIE